MTEELRRHHRLVKELGCIVTRYPYPTIHHCHGGSMNDVLPPSMRPGMAQRQNDWLVIPLRSTLHSTGGNKGIDSGAGVKSWEAKYGSQVEHLDEVCRRLGVNVWRKAGIEREVEGLREGEPQER